jgi:hypothetical protein
MDRTIPATSNEEIELYLRTYYSLLRSSGAIRVKALEETHAAMNSSLHPRAHEDAPDVGAFVYAYLRLPGVMPETRKIVLGQSEEVFERRGFRRVDLWQLVGSPARRRKMFFQDGTLAAFIASVSDIDDIIPMVVAYQIEWNKMHYFLRPDSLKKMVNKVVKDRRPFNDEEIAILRGGMQLDDKEWGQLQMLFGGRLPSALKEIAEKELDFQLMLLASSLTDYRRATQGWWDTITTQADRTFLRYRPVYFVSSNMHSVVNLLSGIIQDQEDEIITYLTEHNPESLGEAYRKLPAKEADRERLNLLYYSMKHYRPDPEAKREWEQNAGIQTIENPLYLDVAVQIIELNQLRPELLDPRLKMKGLNKLKESNALIFNVDYPLGMAAYQLLSQVTSGVGGIRGVYIIGKAASLNARVGDVMIPNVIYDEHSQNTFLFRNTFSAEDLSDYLIRQSVFDNQKAVTVRGTFLQNHEFISVFYKEGYTDIEMEAGPYLSAVYEHIYPKRYPVNEIVNLFINAHYDIGVLHYASDTPYSKRQATLSESLSYRGVDSTYACSIAVLRKIFERELEQL